MSVAHALWETCDLAAKWEASVDLRARVRSKHTLVLRSNPLPAASNVEPGCVPVERTTANCRINASVLHPILHHMNLVQLKLPPIDRLLVAVHEFFTLCNNPLPQTSVYQNAWGLRRLAQLVKSKIYKTDPPKDLWQK